MSNLCSSPRRFMQRTVPKIGRSNRGRRCRPKIRDMPGSAFPEERRRPLDSILETDALRYDACGKGAVKARGKGGVEQDEDAGVAGAADQPPEGLLETQPGQHVVVARAAEYRLARLMQDVRTRPRHAVEDDEPERAAGHVDAIADGIGAEEAGIFLGAKDVDQRRGIHAVDMLGEQR